MTRRGIITDMTHRRENITDENTTECHDENIAEMTYHDDNIAEMTHHDDNIAEMTHMMRTLLK